MGTYGTKNGIVIWRDAAGVARVATLKDGEIQAELVADGLHWASGAGILSADGIAITVPDVSTESATYKFVDDQGAIVSHWEAVLGRAAAPYDLKNEFVAYLIDDNQSVSTLLAAHSKSNELGVGTARVALEAQVTDTVFGVLNALLEGWVVGDQAWFTTNGAPIAIGDAVAETDAVNRQTGDGRYVQLPATPEQGDVLYYNGSTWARLAHGAAGEVLISGGAGANPSWGAATSGGDGVTGSFQDPDGNTIQVVDGLIVSFGMGWQLDFANEDYAALIGGI